MWISEGSLEYMALVGLTNVYQSGVPEKVNMGGKDPFYHLEYMMWKTKVVKNRFEFYVSWCISSGYRL